MRTLRFWFEQLEDWPCHSQWCAELMESRFRRPIKYSVSGRLGRIDRPLRYLSGEGSWIYICGVQEKRWGLQIQIWVIPTI